MELNFKKIENLLSVLDALVEENCKSYSSDWYNYDRVHVKELKAGRWGYLTIRETGCDFTDSIRKHEQYTHEFRNIRFTALIICEDEESYSLTLHKWDKSL